MAQRNLLNLPPELVQYIWTLLDIKDLLTLESVSRKAKEFTTGAYKAACGIPLHRQLSPSHCYRDLAIERLKHHAEAERPSAETVINGMIFKYYGEQDDDVSEIATKYLLGLIASQERGSESWTKAVFITLLAQGGRADEAWQWYDKLPYEKHIDTQTFLAVARFGRPRRVPLLTLNHPQEALAQSLIGASLLGDVEWIRNLHEHDVSLNSIALGHTAATAAASAGHVHVLKFLFSCGVELRNTIPNLNQPLWYAASRNRPEAAEFLLNIGAPLDEDNEESSLTIASLNGSVDTLRIFGRRLQRPCHNITPYGRLRVDPVFRTSRTSVQQRLLTLKYWAVEMGLCLDAVDNVGNRAIHLAASFGDVVLMKELIRLGAGVEALNSKGLTALEVALRCDHSELECFLAEHTKVSLDTLLGQKLAFAKSILSHSHEQSVGEIATRMANENGCKNLEAQKRMIESKWTAMGMDNKLQDIWVRNFSIYTLRFYAEHILVGDLGDAFSKLRHCASEAMARRSWSRVANFPVTIDARMRRLILDLCPMNAQLQGFVENMDRIVSDQLSCEQLRLLMHECRGEAWEGFARSYNAAQPELVGAMLNLMDVVRQDQPSTVINGEVPQS